MTEVKKPGRGGPRPGAGRPKGSGGRPPTVATRRSKDTANRLARAEYVLDGTEHVLPPNATPLDVMVLAMQEAFKEGGAKAAHPYAKDAAPYIHARIAQMELKTADDKPLPLAFRWASEEPES